MKDLIEALQIFAKYTEMENPTACSHDVLYVNVDPKLVSEEDKLTLFELGFFCVGESNGFESFRFGSC